VFRTKKTVVLQFYIGFQHRKDKNYNVQHYQPYPMFLALLLCFCSYL